MPCLNVQEHGQEYKKICNHLSGPPQLRINKMTYLQSYRYTPALEYKHQLMFRLAHIHLIGNPHVAEMLQLLTDLEFIGNAMEVTTASLWHIAAGFAFAD